MQLLSSSLFQTERNGTLSAEKYFQIPSTLKLSHSFRFLDFIEQPLLLHASTFALFLIKTNNNEKCRSRFIGKIQINS